MRALWEKEEPDFDSFVIQTRRFAFICFVTTFMFAFIFSIVWGEKSKSKFIFSYEDHREAAWCLMSSVP